MDSSGDTSDRSVLQQLKLIHGKGDVLPKYVPVKIYIKLYCKNVQCSLAILGRTRAASQPTTIVLPISRLSCPAYLTYADLDQTNISLLIILIFHLKVQWPGKLQDRTSTQSMRILTAR